MGERERGELMVSLRAGFVNKTKGYNVRLSTIAGACVLLWMVIL